MIRLNEYVKDQMEYNLLNENLRIDEGLRSWLKKLFGKTAETIGKVSRFGHDHFTVGWGLKEKDKNDDPEGAQAIEEIADAKTPEDAYEKTKKSCKNAAQGGIKKLKKEAKTALTTCTKWIELAESLAAMAKEKKDEEGEKIAKDVVEKLKEHYGEELFKKAAEASKKTDEKVKDAVGGENSEEGNKEEGNKEEGNKEELPQAQKGEEAGVNDEGKPVATTGTQVEKNTKEAINDNADFLKPLLEKANIDAKVLQRAVNMFSKSIFKEETGNKNGKKVYSWTKEIQDDIDSSSLPNKASELNKKIVDGLSSVICGLLILEKESLINGVYRLIDPKGNSKESLMKMINTKKFDLE